MNDVAEARATALSLRASAKACGRERTDQRLMKKIIDVLMEKRAPLTV